MRIAITGASGLLGGNLLFGWSAEDTLLGFVHKHALASHAEHIQFQATDFSGDEYFHSLERFQPDCIIHTAAITNVDRAENDDRVLAERLHVEVAGRLAAFAQAHGVHFIYISSDHVFAGNRGQYQEIDVPQPLNNYARSKLRGEEVVRGTAGDWTIIRTNFFGFNVQQKQDFAGWIRSMLDQRQSIRLFTDVMFSPLLVNTLVDVIRVITQKRITGLLHIASHDSCSKYEFGLRLADMFSLPVELIQPSSIEGGGLVKRPKNMSLDVSCVESVLGMQLPTVNESIKLYYQLDQTQYQSSLRNFFS